MSEIDTEVKTTKVDYRCEECDIGYMIPTGVMLTSSPPQYPHECDVCSNKMTSYIKYPYLRYDEII